MVQRAIIYGSWFKTVDLGQQDPTAKPIGGNFIFRIEKEVADYFGVTTYEEGVLPVNPTKKLDESFLSKVRAHTAINTYQLDPLKAPSATTKNIPEHYRFKRSGSGGKATRSVLLILPERYDTKRWNKSTQKKEPYKAWRTKSFAFPAYFDNMMVMQFLGCIITKKFPVGIKLGRGTPEGFVPADTGKIPGFLSGAWPITDTEAAKGVEGASLTAAVPQEERKKKGSGKKNI